MLMSLAILLKANGLGDEALTAIVQPLLVGFALMISSVLVWCWHMLTAKETNKMQLGIALAFMLIAATSNQAIFAL